METHRGQDAASPEKKDAASTHPHAASSVPPKEGVSPESALAIVSNALDAKGSEAKAKAKAKAKGKGKAKASGHSAIMKRPAASDVKKQQGAGVSHEASRSQFLVRTGGSGPGTNFLYKYGGNGVSMVAAKAHAEAKLKSVMKLTAKKK